MIATALSEMLPILRKMQDQVSRTQVYGILLMPSSVPNTCMELHGLLYCTNNQYPWMAIDLCNFKHIENINTHTGLVVYNCSGITVIYTYTSSGVGVFISSQTLKDFIWTSLKQTTKILLSHRLMPILFLKVFLISFYNCGCFKSFTSWTTDHHVAENLRCMETENMGKIFLTLTHESFWAFFMK